MTNKDRKIFIETYVSLCSIMEHLENSNEYRKMSGEGILPEFEEIRHSIHLITSRCSEIIGSK